MQEILPDRPTIEIQLLESTILIMLIVVHGTKTFLLSTETRLRSAGDFRFWAQFVGSKVKNGPLLTLCSLHFRLEQLAC